MEAVTLEEAGQSGEEAGGGDAVFVSLVEQSVEEGGTGCLAGVQVLLSWAAKVKGTWLEELGKP